MKGLSICGGTTRKKRLIMLSLLMGAQYRHATAAGYQICAFLPWGENSASSSSRLRRQGAAMHGGPGLAKKKTIGRDVGPSMTSFRLFASSSSQGQEEEKKLSKQQGVYVRPSSAIERGSGFFIPGLEGPKVRLVVGVTLLALLGTNLLLSESGDDYMMAGNRFAQVLAAIYSLLVLVQAAIEYSKEQLDYKNSMVAASGNMQQAAVLSIQQEWLGEIGGGDEVWRDSVEWSAASFVSLTPATEILLFDKACGLLFRLRQSEGYDEPEDGSVMMIACTAALETLSKSQGGRVSVPLTHPCAQAATEADTRCIVLQRLNPEQCLMMTSPQLLAAFTANDLEWLGQLATYIDGYVSSPATQRAGEA